MRDSHRYQDDLRGAFRSPLLRFALVVAAIVLVLAPFFAMANASH
jgi:hypothetical protein